MYPSRFTVINLEDVEDAAIPNGFGHRWEARVARTPLDAQDTGVTHFRLRPGRRSPFAHRHASSEEVYVVLRGNGRVKLDDEIHEVGPLDAIRVGPLVCARSRRVTKASSSSPSARTEAATASRWTTPR